MTEQDRQDGPVWVEISGADRYARAGARVDQDPAATEPARASFGDGRGDGRGDGPPAPAAAAPRRPAGSAAAPGQRLPAAAGERSRYANGQYAPGPLAGRAERIHRLGHARHNAAQTLRDRLPAAVDYARSAITAADEWGVSAPAAVTDLHRVIADLMRVGDTVTAAMRTWSPER